MVIYNEIVRVNVLVAFKNCEIRECFRLGASMESFLPVKGEPVKDWVCRNQSDECKIMRGLK